MADAAPADGGGDAEKVNGAMDMGEEESKVKLCFFACLDFFATIARWCVAAWNGFKWAARRTAYPVKEVVIACTDTWARWYRPYKAKKPQGASVPTFGYGRGVPDFQY
mmetsp:Transcript_72399/g.223702  ORF Transcript_72399/g.223702 Transcript_72399/m.223702 type:complete len:108 (+) Transcript_72399:143-466(+)